MKIIFSLALLLLTAPFCNGQVKKADSLRYALTREKTDSLRADILGDLAATYAQAKPDSELFIAQRALLLSRRIKYIDGEIQDLKLMAEAYEFLGNYPLALNYYLQRLKLDEKNTAPQHAVATMLSIGNLYQLEGDYKLALAYAQKGYLLINKYKLENYRWYSYMTFGDTYDKMNDVANAILYDKKAYDLALKEKNDAWLGMSLNNTGNAYLKAKQYDIALADYRQAIPSLKANTIQNFLCESYQGIATILYQEGKLDSAAWYAKLSLNLAVNGSFSQRYLRSCSLLTDIYKAHHLADSALLYQGKLLAKQDSVYSGEKERQVASLTIAEELRQRERLQEKLEEEKERAYKLNLLMVGLMIPFFFLISLILSKRKMHARVIEFSGIISLLMLFEYLTLLLHPLIVRWTNHSPFLEIMILVALAAVLTPSHHRLEHWMLQKLTAHKHHPAHKPDDAVAEKSTPATAPAVKENDAQGEGKME